jgi:formate hydrogenlyase subunit 6/NADH:ubiquinone oxidoreductase subunit I
MSVLSYFMRSLGNLFMPPVTVAFPAKPREYPAASRGALEIDIDSCIFCGLCVKACPADALAVTKAELMWSLEERRCVSCGACVVICPKKCLALSPEPPVAFAATAGAVSLKVFHGASKPSPKPKAEGEGDGA